MPVAAAPGRHRPASHPVVRSVAMRDAFDDLVAPRASIIGQLREERDPPLVDDNEAIERIARLTAKLCAPASSASGVTSAPSPTPCSGCRKGTGCDRHRPAH